MHKHCIEHRGPETENKRYPTSSRKFVQCPTWHRGWLCDKTARPPHIWWSRHWRFPSPTGNWNPMKVSRNKSCHWTWVSSEHKGWIKCPAHSLVSWHCSTHPCGRLAGLLHILPVDGDLAQDRQLVLGGDLVVLRVEPQQTEQTNCRLYAGLQYLTYLCGINLAASKPNIGLPICVSDSLMDFFFRKTFSPLADTTLNSILPEKVAVNDLERKFIQAHKRKAISRQMWRG